MDDQKASGYRMGEIASETMSRRGWLGRTLSTGAAAASTCVGSVPLLGQKRARLSVGKKPMVQTVLGPVAAEKLGATLMHEHAPVVDWSELFETPPAPIKPHRGRLISETVKLLNAYHRALPPGQGPGAIVEATPIRVGRYPRLLVEIAKRCKVHLVASSGFWCEALAPQHPWAVRLGIAKGGVDRMAQLFIHEITKGMEDPSGKWGERYTNIRAGIIKLGTSAYMRPSERACHLAAAIASKATDCPITTHTTQGGGLEEAELLLKHGASPHRVIIGHQGYMDDRKNESADDYHRLIARLGCYVQFDRVDHKEYGIDKQARQIAKLVEAGFVRQVLVSHDHAPYYCPEYAATKASAKKWKAVEPDYTTIPRKLVPSLRKHGLSQQDVTTILVDNPSRVLAFAKA